MGCDFTDFFFLRGGAVLEVWAPLTRHCAWPTVNHQSNLTPPPVTYDQKWTGCVRHKPPTIWIICVTSETRISARDHASDQTSRNASRDWHGERPAAWSRRWSKGGWGGGKQESAWWEIVTAAVTHYAGLRHDAQLRIITKATTIWSHVNTSSFQLNINHRIRRCKGRKSTYYVPRW